MSILIAKQCCSEKKAVPVSQPVLMKGWEDYQEKQQQTTSSK